MYYRVMHMASPLPLTPVPALRSLPSVALSSDTVKSSCMILFWLAVFKRPAGRLLWPGLAGNYGPAGRGNRLYAEEEQMCEEHKKVHTPCPCAVLHCLCNNSIQNTNFKPSNALGPTVELYFSWTWEADLAEYRAVRSTRVLPVVHVF